jgi:cytochrome P450
MTMDVITYIAFGKSVNAIDAPGFRAPIVIAMDGSQGTFVRFKHAEWYKNMIVNSPPALTQILSPTTMGLINLQQLIKQQIVELVRDPEKLKDLPHGNTVYARLMDKEAYRTGTVPSAESLYEESQALMFGGGDTTGNTLMVATFHLLRNPEAYEKLRTELRSIWPKLDGPVPRLKVLEELPYTNAVIKEGLRMSSGVVSGLLRVVPEEGATICNTSVPGKVSNARLANPNEPADIVSLTTDHCILRKHVCSL